MTFVKGGPRLVQRVIDSYHGVPCDWIRPDDCPTRPGEPCGQIHTVCRGHTKNKGREGVGPRRGDPCQMWAAPGGLVCQRHGAATPQVKAANAERLAEGKAVAELKRRLGVTETREIRNPTIALARLAGDIEQATETAAQMVAELTATIDPDDAMATGTLVATPSGFDVHPYVKLYERLVGQYRGILVDMARIGIEDRIAGVEELEAQVQLGAILAGLDDAGVNTPEVRAAIAARLRGLDDGDDGAAGALVPA